MSISSGIGSALPCASSADMGGRAAIMDKADSVWKTVPQRLTAGANPMVFLFSEEIPELLRGVCPEHIAAAHPLWERSTALWAPWRAHSHQQYIPKCIPSMGDLGGLGDLGGVQERPVQGWTAQWRGPGNVYLCQDCSSALDVAWRLLEWGWLGEGDAVLAVTQWTGRGQVRRPWQSLPGNLHVVWRTPALSKAWDGFSALLPAWLTARTLRRMGWDVRLKWPNDLVWHGRKVGGILVEQRGTVTMVGLGLNLAAVPESGALRGGSVVPAGSMDGRICPARCWEELVFDRVSWYRDHLPVLQPAHFAEAFSQDLLWKGQPVVVTEHDADTDGLRGIVLGVAEDGSLMLSVGGSIQRITFGDVRPAICS